MNVSSSKPSRKLIFLKQSAKTGQVIVSNKGQAVLFARVVMEGIPEAGNEPNSIITLSLALITKPRKVTSWIFQDLNREKTLWQLYNI